MPDPDTGSGPRVPGLNHSLTLFVRSHGTHGLVCVSVGWALGVGGKEDPFTKQNGITHLFSLKGRRHLSLEIKPSQTRGRGDIFLLLMIWITKALTDLPYWAPMRCIIPITRAEHLTHFLLMMVASQQERIMHQVLR